MKIIFWIKSYFLRLQTLINQLFTNFKAKIDKDEFPKFLNFANS